MEPIKKIETLLDVIHEVDRMKRLYKADSDLYHKIATKLKLSLYVQVFKILAQSCNEYVRDMATEVLNAEEIG